MKTKYIVYKRFKEKAICGTVNLPATTECYEEDGVIYTMGGERLCMASSENAHQFFTHNEDGDGIERGELIQSIQKILAERDDNYQVRWDAVWDDTLVCKKYCRAEFPDYWLWNHDFFNAPVSDLRYIKKLILNAQPKPEAEEVEESTEEVVEETPEA